MNSLYSSLISIATTLLIHVITCDNISVLSVVSTSIACAGIAYFAQMYGQYCEKNRQNSIKVIHEVTNPTTTKVVVREYDSYDGIIREEEYVKDRSVSDSFRHVISNNVK